MYFTCTVYVLYIFISLLFCTLWTVSLKQKCDGLITKNVVVFFISSADALVQSNIHVLNSTRGTQQNKNVFKISQLGREKFE